MTAKNRKNFEIFYFLFLAAAAALILMNFKAEAATGVPKIINLQGRLLDPNGNLLGGAGTPYCFRFSIYDDAVPGAPDTRLWPSATPTAMTVTVKNGVFNVGIGDTSGGEGNILDFNFQDNDTVYLNVEVASRVGTSCTDGNESFENLSPRQRIFSSGYAINASTLLGFSASQLPVNNQIPVLNSGNLVLGGINPQINATGTNTLTLQGGSGIGDIQFFSSANRITSTGTLIIAGNLTAGGTILGSNINQSLTTSSSPVFAGLTLNGAASLQDFTFTKATGTGAFTVQGPARFENGLAVVAGSTNLGGLTFTNATGTGNLQVATLITTGQASLNSALITNQLSADIVNATSSLRTGGIERISATGTAIFAGNLTVSGVSSLQGLTFTNATGTNLTLTNDLIIGGTSSATSPFFFDGDEGRMFANGVLRKQHTFREDFAKDRADVTANSAIWGDTQAINFLEIGAITLLIRDDVTNGISACTAMAAGEGCLFNLAGPTAGTDPNLIYNAANRPAGLFQVKPLAVGLNNDVFVGFSDLAADTTGSPANGFYFSNENGTSWVPVVRQGGVSQTTGTCPGATISTAQFALLRVDVLSTSSAHFFVDPDVSDGISFIDCGVVQHSAGVSAQMSFTVFYKINTGGTAADFELDFLEVVQDDPVTSDAQVAASSPAPLNPELQADIAEAYLAEGEEITKLLPGTIVAFDTKNGLHVKRSNAAYEKTLLGVISLSPYLVMGEERDGEETVRVAIKGRVPVRVNLQNGPIEVGDWLTSSDEPGVAMRATKPGMVIGRALEALSGQGAEGSEQTILATVEVQYWPGPDFPFFASISELLKKLFGKVEKILTNVGEAVEELARLGVDAGDKLAEILVEKIVAKSAAIETLFAKSITVLPDGNIILPEGKNQVSGQGVIPAGSLQVIIQNKLVNESSKIFVMPTAKTEVPLFVSGKVSGQGFAVNISQPQLFPVTFDWLLINTYKVGGSENFISAASEIGATAEANAEVNAGSSVESSADATGEMNTEPNQDSSAESGGESNGEVIKNASGESSAEATEEPFLENIPATSTVAGNTGEISESVPETNYIEENLAGPGSETSETAAIKEGDSPSEELITTVENP